MTGQVFGEIGYCVDAAGARHEHRPGKRYCRACWPPRGRGRGEDLYSARRVEAALVSIKAIRMRELGLTYTEIAGALGYADASGAWYAINGHMKTPSRGTRRREARRDARERKQDAIRTQDWIQNQGA